MATALPRLSIREALRGEEIALSSFDDLIDDV